MLIGIPSTLYNPYSNVPASAVATACSIACEAMHTTLFKSAVWVHACRRIVNVWADQSPFDLMWADIPPLVVPSFLEHEMIGVDTAFIVTEMAAVRIPDM